MPTKWEVSTMSGSLKCLELRSEAKWKRKRVFVWCTQWNTPS